MCLSVPMKIEEIDGLSARCSALGEERNVNLALLGDGLPQVGDYVIVHLQYAQRIVPEADAKEAYALFSEILDAMNGR